MNQLRKVSNLKEVNLFPGAIELAVRSFVADSHTKESGADPDGLYQQTIEGIAAATFLRQNDSRDLWLADEDGEVMAYTLTHVSKDVDNRLCYWITQAWVHPMIRGSKMVKSWIKLFEGDAKRKMCSHMIVPSSRGAAGYCRFLGEGWGSYVTLLKKDI